MIYIEIKSLAINKDRNSNGINNLDASVDLYQVIVNSNNYNMLVTVAWNEPTILNQREFKVVKLNNLSIFDMDNHRNISTNTKKSTPYPQVGSAIDPKGDLSIVQELFKDQLEELGIKINSISVHSLDSFESNDFTFVDDAKREVLYELIDKKCKEAMTSNYTITQD